MASNGWEDLSSPKSTGGWEDLGAPEKSGVLASYESNVPQVAKDFVGGIEGLGLGATSFVEGTLRKGYSHAAGILSGQGVEATQKRAAENQPFLTPQTESGKQVAEGVGSAVDWVKEHFVDLARPRSDPQGWDRAKQGPYDPLADSDKTRASKVLKQRAMSEGALETWFDAEMAKAGMVAPLKGIKSAQEAKVKAQELKDKYDKGQAATANQWEDMVAGEEAKVQERTMQDQGTQARDLGQIDMGNNTPFRVAPEDMARIEEEHNPTNAPEMRQEGQGELFTDQKALTPDEAAARRYSVSEEGVGARDRVQAPSEKFEIGQEVEHPTYTADDVNGARQAAGEAGFREEGPFQGEKALDPNRPNQANRRAALLEEVNKERGPGFWETAADRKVREFDRQQDPRYAGLRRKQGGVVDPDLLTFGTAKIWEKIRDGAPTTIEAMKQMLDKFKGTFDPQKIELAKTIAARKHYGHETVVLMSPDDFHRLAMPRDESSPYFNHLRGEQRESVRQGLKTENGLRDIPYLNILDNQVIGHEGRHRMDIFKEQGIDLVPVMVRLENARGKIGMGWGERVTPWPERVRSEDGTQHAAWPQSLAYPKEPATTVSTRPNVPLRQRGALGDWDKRVAKKGLTQTMLEQKKALEEETRPLGQIVKDEKIDPATIQDLVPERKGLLGRLTSAIEKSGSRLLIDRSLAILAQSKEGTGKIVKWAVDSRERLDRLKDIGIGTAVKAALEPWQKLKSSTGDLRKMLDVWQSNIGKGALTKEHFKNDRQWEVFNSTRKVLNDTIKKVNDTRSKYGLKTIPYIDNYLPAIWQGDYRVWVKNGAGENVGVFAFKNTYQADMALKTLRKEHPDLSVEDPVHVKKTQDYHDFSAFEEAMRIHNKDYQATKALQDTYARLLKQKGFGPHGMYRQNLFGYLGFEKGDLGVKNSELAIEAYIKRAENHIANIEKSNLSKQLAELPTELQEKIPTTMKYLQDYMSQARGVDLSQLKWIDQRFEQLAEGLGIGRSAPASILRDVSGFASLYFLVTPKFMATQVLQPLNMIPKMLQLSGRIEDTRSVASSVWHGYQNMLFPDKAVKEAVKWAKDNDFLDPAIVALINMKKTDLSTERGHVIADKARKTLGWVEKNLVRTPTYLAFEHMLRDSIKDPKERYSAAARMMDYYMVHYDTGSSPLIYNDLGLVGEAARPLKQYSHNTWGQFLEYIQGTKKGEFAPLAGFMGNQALVAGLRGTIGFAEATAVVTAINNIFGTDYTTPEQWLLKSGASDIAVFGLPSTLMGYDMSSSVAAPALPQMFAVMPVTFAVEATKDIGNWFLHYATGELTDQDTLKLLLATTPSAMRGYWEEVFTKEGEPVPHPNMKMQGTYVRNPEEKRMAKLGIKSISEARKDNEARIFKQIFMKDAQQKISAVDVIADRVMNNEDIPDFLIDKYISEGGDPHRLGEDIKNRVKGRMLPWEDQQLIGPMSPQKLHKLEIMRDALDRETQSKEIEQGQTNLNRSFMKKIDYRDDPKAQMPGGNTDAVPPGAQKGLPDWFHSLRPDQQIEVLRELKRKQMLVPGVNHPGTRDDIPTGDNFNRPRSIEG